MLPRARPSLALPILLVLQHMLAFLVSAEPLKIRPKQCNNALGEEGTCMFVWECIKTEGKHLGTCADGFLFGSCCGHNDSANSIMSHMPQSSSIPMSITPTVSTITPTVSAMTDKVKPSQTTAITVSSVLEKNKMKVKPSQTPTTTPAASTKPMTLKPSIVQTILTIRPANTTKPSGYVTPNNYKPTMVPTTARPWQVFTGHNKPFLASTFRPSYVSVGPVKNRPPIYFIRPTLRPTHTPPPTPTNLTHMNIVAGNDNGKSPVVLPGVGEGTIVLTSNLSPPRPSIPLSQISNVTNVVNNKTESISSGGSEGQVSPSSKYECGVTQMRPKSKIVGGKNSAFGAWPWQVSVRRTSFFGFTSTHRCGGVLLTDRWIATAGHCVDDLLLTQIRIRVGEYDFSTAMEPLPYMERGAKKKVVHPKYNFFTYENDLALVQLDEPVEFAPHVSPICLPPDEVELIGKNATVTGWGRLSEGGVLPTVLQEVRVPIMSNERCKNMFLSAGRHEYIPDIFMCAGYEEGGRDSCQGDSGGPLQVQADDGKWFLGGIVSWGISCGEPGLPGVCTRITKFKNWIRNYIAT